MLLSSIEFISQYADIVAQIERVVRPEYFAAIRELYCVDPHDLVEPDHYFHSRNAAIGFVFSHMERIHKEQANAVSK